MSELPKNAEIEDVLASIRRLVAGGAAKTRAEETPVPPSIEPAEGPEDAPDGDAPGAGQGVSSAGDALDPVPSPPPAAEPDRAADAGTDLSDDPLADAEVLGAERADPDSSEPDDVDRDFHASEPEAASDDDPSADDGASDATLHDAGGDAAPALVLQPFQRVGGSEGDGDDGGEGSAGLDAEATGPSDDEGTPPGAVAAPLAQDTAPEGRKSPFFPAPTPPGDGDAQESAAPRARGFGFGIIQRTEPPPEAARGARGDEDGAGVAEAPAGDAPRGSPIISPDFARPPVPRQNVARDGGAGDPAEGPGEQGGAAGFVVTGQDQREPATPDGVRFDPADLAAVPLTSSAEAASADRANGADDHQPEGLESSYGDSSEDRTGDEDGTVEAPARDPRDDRGKDDAGERATGLQQRPRDQTSVIGDPAGHGPAGAEAVNDANFFAPHAEGPAYTDLRALVAEIVRQELEGAAGSRASDRIRALVRDEVARAVQSSPSP